MTDTTERAELPHKLDTLIRALPEAPFREHLRSECQAQAERIKTLEKMREEADEVEGSLRQRIASLEAERDKLRADVERLRADAERLDWIEHQYLEDLVMGLAVDCEHDGQYYVCGDDNKTGYGDSLRAAIDAARTHKETK